jgi:predicted nucleic acid-binding protein
LKIYADTSFLALIYLAQPDSKKALALLQAFRDPLPFTPLHRHELRNGIRLAVFRKEIDAAQRKAIFLDLESDLKDGILTHVPIPWTDAFREAEELGDTYNEAMGVRATDLLHVGLAMALGLKEFLTFDFRQAEIAKAGGLKVWPKNFPSS